jgi:hypothetical protein
MTEQALVPTHQGVYKRNLVMNRLAGGVHDNTDGTSDDEVIQTQPIHQGITKLGQVTCQTNDNIHPLMTGRRQNVAPHINKNLNYIQYFHVVLCSCYHSVGGGDKQIQVLPAMPGLP